MSESKLIDLKQVSKERIRARSTVVRRLLDDPTNDKVVVVVRNVDGIWTAVSFDDMNNDELIGALESAKLSVLLSNDRYADK